MNLTLFHGMGKRNIPNVAPDSPLGSIFDIFDAKRVSIIDDDGREFVYERAEDQ